MNTLDTGLAYETGYPLAAHTYTLEAQFGVNAGSTIGAPRPAVDIDDPVPQ